MRVSTILDEIVAAKRLEVAEAKERVSLASLQEAARTAGGRRSFEALFENGGTVLIAEIKPKSPSAGVLIERSPIAIAEIYAKSIADVISVLTDNAYFGGSLQLLKDIRGRVPQAILRKDFIIDTYQIYESRAAGADAILLIAAILTDAQLREFLTLAGSLGLDALVEVHDEAELKRAVASGARVIGINNRDLTTMVVDLATSERLVPHVPDGTFIVSESGIETAEDAKHLRSLGVQGILVGTSVLRSADPLAHIADLKHALTL